MSKVEKLIEAIEAARAAFLMDGVGDEVVDERIATAEGFLVEAFERLTGMPARPAPEVKAKIARCLAVEPPPFDGR